MKRYAVFTARFALVPMISGAFLGSTTGRESWLEWAHIVAGFATVYLILGLLLISAKNGQNRLFAAMAFALGLLEAIPGMPRLHALVSPVLFATLACGVFSLHSVPETALRKSHRVFALPALVLLPIFYGVGYRHQTSGFVPHVGAALLAAGTLLVFCMVQNERHPENKRLRRDCNLTIAAVVFQIVFGFAAFIIRLLEIEGGLWLAIVRTAHITGAAPVLAASAELAIQYRRI
jgi:heme A synthase